MEKEFRKELDALREPIERLEALLTLHPYKISHNNSIRELFSELENEEKNDAFYLINTNLLE